MEVYTEISNFFFKKKLSSFRMEIFTSEEPIDNCITLIYNILYYTMFTRLFDLFHVSLPTCSSVFSASTLPDAPPPLRYRYKCLNNFLFRVQGRRQVHHRFHRHVSATSFPPFHYRISNYSDIGE